VLVECSWVPPLLVVARDGICRFLRFCRTTPLEVFRVLIVGLTGGIGAGKSAVATLLAEHGAVVIDADKLAREAVEPGSEGLDMVVAEFGPDVLDATGALDRSALARRVFGDEPARRRLEAIVHPLVRLRSAELIATLPVDSVVVNDVPLLVESNLAGLYEVVVVVLAPEAVRVERLVRDRDMTESEARARIAAQATDDQRRAVADIVVDNDGTLDELRAKVDEVWAKLTGSG
jgi:dephospho-CoA kinase